MSNKTEIDKFFKLFDKKENKYLLDIQYAYDLAFMTQNYSKMLQYKDMYEKHLQDMFLDIALNIDKVEYIQKFIEYKDDWTNLISSEVKEFFITIIEKQEKLDISFFEVLEFLENCYKIKLINKIPVNKALEIINNISDRYKSKALAYIVPEIDDIKKALEIVNKIPDEYYKSEALGFIISKINTKDLLEKVLEIVNGMSDYCYKSESLDSIVSEIDDKDLLKKILEMTDSISDDKYKSEALASVVLKINDRNLLEKALEIVPSIYNDEYKFEPLESIILKIDTKDLVEKVLKIANKISDDYCKSEILATLVSQIDDKDLLKKILNMITNRV